jgi:hypothetical protein
MQVQGLLTYYFLVPKNADAAHPSVTEDDTYANKQGKRSYKDLYDTAHYPHKKHTHEEITKATYVAASDFLSYLAENPTDKNHKQALIQAPQILTTTTLSDPAKPLDPTHPAPSDLDLDHHLTYTFTVISRTLTQKQRKAAASTHNFSLTDVEPLAYSLVITTEATSQPNTSTTSTPSTSPAPPAPPAPPALTEAQISEFTSRLKKWFAQMAFIGLVVHPDPDKVYHEKWPTFNIKFSEEDETLHMSAEGEADNWLQRFEKTHTHQFIINSKRKTRNVNYDRRNFYSHWPTQGVMSAHAAYDSFIRVVPTPATADEDTPAGHDELLFVYQHDPEADFLCTYGIKEIDISDPDVAKDNVKFKQISNVINEVCDVSDAITVATQKET